MNIGSSPDGPILICYDGSDCAKEAIARAEKLLAPADAVVLYVWLPLSHVLLWNPLFPAPGPLAEPAAELDSAGREAALRLAEEGAALARAAGFEAVAATAESRHGAWRTILRCAEERAARVIVVGSQGMSPVSGARLGGVAAGVTHHARRPVLVASGPRPGEG